MKIGIIGCTGRLANEIIELLQKQNVHTLSSAIARKGNQSVGKTINFNSELVEISSDIMKCETCDVLIDATRRDVFIEQNIDNYKKLGKPLVIATTGFNKDDEEKIKDLSTEIPVCKSANFSEELLYFIESLKTYSKFTNTKNVVIVEYHHINKKDIPSGTSLLIRDEIIAANTEISVSINSIRAGDIKGEHVILFANDYGEEVVFKHKATNRSVFAGGIIKAAEKLVNKKPAFYTFSKLLEEKKL